MARACVIGVMGAGENACREDIDLAHQLGIAIARSGWVLLCGGRNAGVMASAIKGVTAGGGLSLGLLPGDQRDQAATGLSLALPTGLGHARNAVNVLASDVVVVCASQAGPGTFSEWFLALKAKRPTLVAGLPTHLRPALEELCPNTLFTQGFTETWLALKEQVDRLASSQAFLPLFLAQRNQSIIN